VYEVNGMGTHEHTATNPTRAKCGGSHNSKDCNKQRGTPAKCALCGGNHLANYKGCEHHHNIIKGNNPHRTPPESSKPIPTSAYNHITTPHSLPQQQQQQQHSYTDVASNHTQLAEAPITTLKTFLEDFKGLFAQLIHQNSLILNMLTILNKPH
jgi:hypothetical protein